MATKNSLFVNVGIFVGILLVSGGLTFATLYYFADDPYARFGIIATIIIVSIVGFYLSQCPGVFEPFVGAPTKNMGSVCTNGVYTPNTMPGAVSNDSTRPPASYKDIAALLDAMKIYNNLYEMFLLHVAKNSEYTLLHTKSIAYAIKLQAQIDTGKIVDKAETIRIELNKYNRAIKSIRNNESSYKSENHERAKSVTVNMISADGPVTLYDLTYAVERARHEKKRIDDIRSESPDFKQRSFILEKVQLDLEEIHNKIIRKDIDESQIPICKKELQKFLMNVEDPTSKIEPIPGLQPALVCDKERDYILKKDTTPEIEGFVGNQEALSDMEAQAYADSLSNNQNKKALKLEINEIQAYVGDDALFTPSNKLDRFAEFVPEGATEKGVEAAEAEGFTNYKDVCADNSSNKSSGSSGSSGSNGSNKSKMEAREYNKNVKKAQAFMKDLSWDVNIGVGYDPNVTIQRKISERLQHIMNDIESGTLDRIKMRAKMTELEILKQQLETINRRNLTAASGTVDLVDKNTDLGDADTSDNLLLTDKTMPKNLNYTKKYAPGDENSPVRQEILTTIESPLASNDYLIRPGYQMTDEEIARRGSRATFDETKVGGADYKKNVKFLCQQIKAAGLGDPSEFGCIANQQSDVGPDYSWKGNYKMVCSRLGNTWGSWYPEMFGCPKQDVSHTQMPKINRDCTFSSITPPQEKPSAPCVIKESSSTDIIVTDTNSNEPTSCDA